MHARVKALIDYASRCGFELDGQLDGSGHYVLKHPNGERVRVAATPGDWRGDRNAEAEMRRKSGVTPAKPNAAKYRHAGRLKRFEPATERVESVSTKVARLSRDHREVCERIAYLLEAGATRAEMSAEVRALVACEAEIKSLGRRPPLLTFRLPT